MIRLAEIKDVPVLVELGKGMHRDSQYGQFSYDEEKVANFVHTVIVNEDGVAYVSEDSNGVIHGGILGWVSQHWFGFDLMMSDIALYVDAKSRGGMVAARLIRRFIQHGEEAGCKQIVLSNSTGYEKERVAKLYDRMGMDHVGYVYAHNPKDE